MTDEIASIDIPIDGEAHCRDGRSGTLSMVIINPVSKNLSFVVVAYRGTEYLVPRSSISATTPDLIVLGCTRKELTAMEPFKAQYFIDADLADYDFGGEYHVEPFVDMEREGFIEEEELIPPGQLAIRRTNEVYARDGKIGAVDEFVVSRKTGDITHMVLREGFPRAKQEIAIPISAIEKAEDDRVYLNISKDQIAALPRVRVNRWWD